MRTYTIHNVWHYNFNVNFICNIKGIKNQYYYMYANSIMYKMERKILYL